MSKIIAQKSLQFREGEEELLKYLSTKGNICKFVKELIKKEMEEENNPINTDLITKQLAREEIYNQMKTNKFRENVLEIMTEYIEVANKLADAKPKKKRGRDTVV